MKLGDPAKGQPKDAIFAFLLLATPLLALDSLLWFEAVPSGLHWAFAIIVHLMLVSISYLAIVWHRSHNYDLRFVAINALFGTMMGPFGMMTTIFAACVSKLMRTDGIYFEELLQELLPELHEHRITESARRLRSGLERVDVNTTPVPFLDLMAFGSMDQKRAVIGAALRYFSPELTRILRAGLRDPANSIRVLAATALVTLEEKYHSRFVELQKEVVTHPDDKEVLEAYAKHCSYFAFSNILGEERAAKMRQLAISAYEALLKDQGPSIDLCCDLARLYIAENQFSEALSILDKWMNSGSSSPSGVLDLYSEALFRLGRYEELRLLGEQYAAALESPLGAVQAPNPLGLWTQSV